MAVRKASDAEVLEREPELERPGGARELDAAIGEVDVPPADERVLEVVRHDVKRRFEPRALAHEDAAGLVRLVEPLVRVERRRVGALEAAEGRAASFGQHREPAVRSVDVEPDPVRAADVGELVERIDRARVGGACIADRREGLTSGRDVRLDRSVQRLGADPVQVVDRHEVHLLGPEAEHANRPRHRRVALGREVHDRTLGLRAGNRLARAGEGGQVRLRAARDEDPGGLGRPVEPLPEPVDDDELRRARPRGLKPGAGEEVRSGGDEVADDTRPRRTARHEPEEARMVVLARKREHVLLESRQQLLRVGRLLGRRLAQTLLHLGPGRPPPRRPFVEARDPIDEEVDGAIAEAAHLLGVELERVRRRALTRARR